MDKLKRPSIKREVLKQIETKEYTFNINILNPLIDIYVDMLAQRDDIMKRLDLVDGGHPETKEILIAILSELENDIKEYKERLLI